MIAFRPSSRRRAQATRRREPFPFRYFRLEAARTVFNMLFDAFCLVFFVAGFTTGLILAGSLLIEALRSQFG